jgi:hypothetical protein
MCAPSAYRYTHATLRFYHDDGRQTLEWHYACPELFCCCGAMCSKRSRGTTHVRRILLNFETNQLPWQAHPPLTLPSPLINPAVLGFSANSHLADAPEIPGLAHIFMSAGGRKLFIAGCLSRTDKPRTCVVHSFSSNVCRPARAGAALFVSIE